MRWAWKFFPVLLLASLNVGCVTEKPLPDLRQGPIVDQADILTSAEKAKLEAKINAYRDSTGNVIAVAIVQSLGGKSIEDYAHDVFNLHGLGDSAKSNGVLFLAAMDDHKARIEVGYGLEAELTDIECGRLVNKDKSVMASKFRDEDYAAGIEAVIDGIIQGIGGEYVAPEPEPVNWTTVLIVLAIILVAIIVICVAAGGFTDGMGIIIGALCGGDSDGGGGGFGGFSGGGGASGGW